VDPSGKFAYVANSNSFSVSMYTINATTGVLTSVGAIGAGDYPESVAVDPSGKFAYVANFGDHLAGIPGSVSTYRINADGSLTSTGTTAEPYEGTASMAVHLSGKVRLRGARPLQFHDLDVHHRRHHRSTNLTRED